MNKKIKIICATIAVAVFIFSITYSYVLAIANVNTNQPIKEQQFFEISQLEITKKDKVEMTLNLDSIEFNDFVFELKSDENLRNVEILENNTIETEKSNHEIIMEINKAKTNVETINFYYAIPDDKKVGDTIKFRATVTSLQKNETAETDKDKAETVENNKDKTIEADRNKAETVGNNQDKHYRSK